MTEKRRVNAGSKLKNLLITGSMEESPRKEDALTEEIAIDDVVESPEPAVADSIPQEPAPAPPAEVPAATVPEPAPVVAPAATTQIDSAALLDAVNSLKANNEVYMTSKEQHRAYMEAVDKRDAEIANKKLMTMMSQLCTMREDFFKLCTEMEKKLDKFTSKDILDSFKAYSTDMEIMLTDSGVYIGKFDFNKLNTIHQRIVDMVPTSDESQNGLIAERMSEGYSYNGRVLLKEKVKVYKYTEKRDE